jgi:hypothetical protein
MDPSEAEMAEALALMDFGAAAEDEFDKALKGPPMTNEERERAMAGVETHSASQKIAARQRAAAALGAAYKALGAALTYTATVKGAALTAATLRMLQPDMAAALRESSASGDAGMLARFCATNELMNTEGQWQPALLGPDGLDGCVANAMWLAMEEELKRITPQGVTRELGALSRENTTHSRDAPSEAISDASWMHDTQRMLKDAKGTLTVEEAMALFAARQKAASADGRLSLGTPRRSAQEAAAIGAAGGGAEAPRAAGAADGGAARSSYGGGEPRGGGGILQAAPPGTGGPTLGTGGRGGGAGHYALAAGALLPAPENAFKKATKLWRYIPHRLQQHEYEDTDLQLTMSGTGVALKRKDTSKMIYLTAFQFDEAAHVAETTDYAHCAHEHAEHIQLLKNVWDLYDPKHLQDYDAAVRDNVMRMPDSVGFTSNHAHLWKQHVETPQMLAAISRKLGDANTPAPRYRAQGRDGPPRAAPGYGGNGGRGSRREQTFEERRAEHEEYAAAKKTPEKHWALCRDFGGGGCPQPATCWYAHWCADPACGWGVGRFKCGGNHPPAAAKNGGGRGRGGGGGGGGGGYGGRGGGRYSRGRN